ncbi:hypothetical protein [Sorangium sp. So ce887]|uniref:hypothetical protein n=1 Tax=Sorangium sp. So ce887 TaxID=3133324 RepID=UPI003F5E21F4
MARAQTKPPHPATVAQKKAAPAKSSRPPHPATVAQKKAAPAKSSRPPHPATVAQKKAAPAKPARPPHPATVVQKKAAPAKPARPPHPATVVQKKAAPAKPARPPHPVTGGAAAVAARRPVAGAVQRAEQSGGSTFIAVDSLAAYCRWAKENAAELRGQGGRRLWKEYGERIEGKVGIDRALNKEVALLEKLYRNGKGKSWDEVASVDDLLDKLEGLYGGNRRLSTLIITGHANESSHNLGQGNLDVADDLGFGPNDAATYKALQLHRSEIKISGLSRQHWPGVFERLKPIACTEGKHNRFYVFLLGCNSGGPPPSLHGGNFLLNALADVLFNDVFESGMGVGVFGASLETKAIDTDAILRNIDNIKDAGKPWFNLKRWEAMDAYEDGKHGLYGVFRDPV